MPLTRWVALDEWFDGAGKCSPIWKTEPLPRMVILKILNSVQTAPVSGLHARPPIITVILGGHIPGVEVHGSQMVWLNPKIKLRRSKRECMSFRQPSINPVPCNWFLIGTGQQAFRVILFWQVLGVQIFCCQLGTDHAFSLSWDGNIVDNSFKSWEA